MLGGWALWITLPIYVYQVTGSALATSAVVAAVVAPGVILGSVAGVFVDRWNRKTTLVVGNLLLAAVTVPLFVVSDDSRLWLVYPLVFLSEVIDQFTSPAENAFLPRLVPTDELVQANAMNSLNNSLARLIGPAAGGALFLAGGLGTVAVVDALTFVLAAVLVAAVRTSGAPEPAEASDDDAAHALVRVGREWIDGLRVIRRSRAVSVIFGVTAATAVGEGIMGVMFIVWIKKVIDGGAPELGWFMSGQAVGGVLGGLAAGWFARRLQPERLFGWGLLVFGLVDLALFNYPLAFGGVVIGLVLIAIVGIPGVASRAARETLIQADVEDRYRGRVFGALGTTAAALMLVATFVAGAVGDAVGPIAMLNVQGGAYVVSGVAVLLLLTPAVNAARRPAAASREAELANP